MAEQFGKYQVEEVVGQGAFGTVYRAVDSSLGRVVALKVLHPILMTDELWVGRFRREGTAMARLHHPHIAIIYEIGELTGRLFIAMQYVPGPNLGQRLKEGGSLTWEEALSVTQAVTGALDHAHRAGVLHRDLKPENILLGPEGPVLTDFGVAQLIGESRAGSTLSGGIVGTPHYIAPEVWRGQPSTPAADCYALACIVAEMLTGKRLYDGPSTPAVMHAHFQPPELPAEWPAGTPPGLSELLKKALQQEPDGRFGAAGEFASALAAMDAPREPAPPVRKAVPAVSAASTVSTGAGAVTPASETPRLPLPKAQAQAEPHQAPDPSPRLLIGLGVVGAVMALVLGIWGLSAIMNAAGGNSGTTRVVAAATATDPPPPIVSPSAIALSPIGAPTAEEEAATEEEEAAQEEETEVVGETIILRLFTLDAPDQLLALVDMVEAWKASDPKWANVQVVIDAVPLAQLFPAIETSVPDEADFDAFLADGPEIKHYAYNRTIIPLREFYTAEEIAEFVPQSVEEGSYLGTFYAPAIMQSCSMMFYNSDMTDEAGLQPPQAVAGWTMDESWDAWEKTTIDNTGDGTPDIWGLRWGQGTWWGDYEQGIPRRSAGARGTPTFEGMGADGITFVGYLDTPEAIAAYQTFRDWHIGDRAVSPVEPIPQPFVNGQHAFMISPDNRIGEINRLYPDGGFNWGVTGIPYFADGTQLCHTGSWHFGVSPNSEHQEAAVSMVKFFAGSEGSRIWYEYVRQLPARFDLLNTLPEYSEYPQQMFSTGLQEIGRPRIQTPCYLEYQQIHAALLQDLSQGQGVDVEQLVTTAAQNMEQACAKYAGWNE